MSHSVTCGSCNATFAIPDEVWEKRVEGQLATLKCRQCKGPIQIDGRPRKGAGGIVEIKPNPTSTAAALIDQSSLEEPTTIWTAPHAAAIANKVRDAKKQGSTLTREAAVPPAQNNEARHALAGTKSSAAASSDRASVTQSDGGATPAAAKGGETAGLSLAQEKLRTDPLSREDKQQTHGIHGTPKEPRHFQAPNKAAVPAPSLDKAVAKQKVAPANAQKTFSAPKVATYAGTAARGKAPSTETAAAADPPPQTTNLASTQTPASNETESAEAGKPTEASRSPAPAKAEVASDSEGASKSAPVATTAATKPGSAEESTKHGTTRAGGPPPLRKALPSTPEQQGNTPQRPPNATQADRKPSPGGPPPLPRQSPPEQSVLGSVPKDSPRVHSPASMPVVAAMAIPSAPPDTSAGAPRPSDIAALVKIRPKFPKWLPFAVLGAVVLAVSGLAALSWVRGDAAAEKGNRNAPNDPKLMYPQPTSTSVTNTISTSQATVSPSAGYVGTTSAAFANQFAQAAAKQRPTARFDREAAEKALALSFAKAASCHNKGDPTGSAPTTISISPSGQVLSVTIGPPFAGTYTAECIRNILVEAKCPPFQGAPGRLVHSISIR